MTNLRKVEQEELYLILEKHKLWLDSNKKKGERANLSDCDLSYLDLNHKDCRNIDFSCSNLTNVNLTGANCKNANFYSCVLYKSNCINVNFTAAKFRHAKLEESLFSYSDFTYSDFYSSELHFSDFTSANFTDADLRKTMCFKTHFSSANFEKAKCKDMFLHDADFTNVKRKIKESSYYYQIPVREQKMRNYMLAINRAFENDNKYKAKELAQDLLNFRKANRIYGQEFLEHICEFPRLSVETFKLLLNYVQFLEDDALLRPETWVVELCVKSKQPQNIIEIVANKYKQESSNG